MSSSYDRGRRGGHHGSGGRDRDYDNSRERRDSRDRKRPRDNRDNSQGRLPRGKFQKRGGGRGRGGRGGRGGKKQEQPEFRDVIVTKPRDLPTKTVSMDDPAVQNDKPITLITNYFKVDTRQRVTMTQYRIDFEPEIENRRLRETIIKETRDLGLNVYDGANTVYLMTKLPEKDITKLVTLRNGDRFDVRFRESREILYTDAMFFTILNLIIRRCFEAQRLTLVGRNYYDSAAAKRVAEHRIDLWPGYKTSIRQHEENLLLCCELTYKMMRTQNVWTTIQDLARTSRGAYKVEAERAIIGITILTTYNNKKYKIHEIDWNPLGRACFPCNGIEKSYIDYYREKYHIDGLDPNQPLLVSMSKAKDIRGGASEKIVLIPQLCQPTGVNDSMRHNFRLMKDMAEHMRMTPDERIRKLVEFNRRLQDNPECQKNFHENQLELSRELVKVDARRIVQEEIFFQDAEPVKLPDYGRDAADWTNAMKNKKMFICEELVKWVFICTKKSENTGLTFINKLIEAGRNLGMNISENYKREFLPNDKIQTYTEALRYYLGKDPKMIIIVVDNNDGDRYAAIKKFCYCSSSNRPVPIQILCSRTIADGKRGIMSVATKVAIQINSKLGGIPWIIKIPLKGLLVIGFDVTHDTQDRSKSFGAMVASLNPENQGGKFFCCANSHKNGEQISNYLGANIIAAIRKYQQLNNGVRPQRIIIYRDGVGDGQIEYVNNFEVKDILSKVHRFYNYDPKDPEDPENEPNIPKIGFIIINKRINTRFFIKNERDGRADNPLPGTVVDSVVTLPERYDFYLISQSVNQGTVSPTSYNIIYDKLELRTAHIQRLSFKFCHTYFNWSGTTRVPSVVQYAKKLALLIGQHMHQEPTNFDDDQMLYFL